MSRSRHRIFVNLRELADIQVLLECRWDNIRSNTLNVSMSRAVIVSLANRERYSGSTHKSLKDLFSPWAIGSQYNTFSSQLVNCWNTQGM